MRGLLGLAGQEVGNAAEGWGRHDGKFAYTGANGLAIVGVIRTPTGIDGSINATSCESTYWYANKK